MVVNQLKKKTQKT